MAFVDEFARAAQKVGKERGYKIVSPLIAQGILESASGTSNKVVDPTTGAYRGNYLGIKYNAKTPNRVSHASGFFAEYGSEQNADGSYSGKTMTWYSFADMEQCIQGYYDFLENIYDHRYDALRTISDPLTYITLLKTCGYATSQKYIENVYNVVLKYNLTQYDTISEVTKPNIVLQTSTNATTLAQGRKIEYIVVHYTAGTTSKGGSASNVASYFNKSGKASADFIVDDDYIVQYNADILNRYAWHCGGNKYNTKGGSLYGICKNSNSIGIEICSNNRAGIVTSPNDAFWYFTDKSLENAKSLIKYLMKEYGISADKVVRHYDVTGKPCPAIVGWNADTVSEAEWLNFKASLGAETPQTTKQYWRVQCGAFKNKDNAEMLKAKLIECGFNAIIKEYDGLFKVQTGAFSKEANANDLKAKLKAQGFNAFVTYC